LYTDPFFDSYIFVIIFGFSFGFTFSSCDLVIGEFVSVFELDSLVVEFVLELEFDCSFVAGLVWVGLLIFPAVFSAFTGDPFITNGLTTVFLARILLASKFKSA